jgi:hypothetical protein
MHACDLAVIARSAHSREADFHTQTSALHKCRRVGNGEDVVVSKKTVP